MKVIYKFKNHKKQPYTVGTQKKIVYQGVDCYGLCDAPSKKEGLIKLKESLKGYDMAQVVLHELVHAYFYEESEKTVEKFVRTYLRLLDVMKIKIVES
jgi:hypothetical protein